MGWWRKEWKGPTFMAVGCKDPILGIIQSNPIDSILRQLLMNYDRSEDEIERSDIHQ